MFGGCRDGVEALFCESPPVGLGHGTVEIDLDRRREEQVVGDRPGPDDEVGPGRAHCVLGQGSHGRRIVGMPNECCRTEVLGQTGRGGRLSTGRSGHASLCVATTQRVAHIARQGNEVTIGLSILIAASGAILRYAVADNIDNVDLRMVGLILMIAGAVGLLAGLIMTGLRRRDAVVVDNPRVVRRTHDERVA